MSVATLELITDAQAELVGGGRGFTLLDLSGSNISIGNRGAIAQFASIEDSSNFGNGEVKSVVIRRPRFRFRG